MPNERWRIGNRKAIVSEIAKARDCLQRSRDGLSQEPLEMAAKTYTSKQLLRALEHVMKAWVMTTGHTLHSEGKFGGYEFFLRIVPTELLAEVVAEKN